MSWWPRNKNDIKTSHTDSINIYETIHASFQHADLKGTFQKNTLMFSKLLIKLAAIVLHALLEANCSNISENKNSTDV